MSTKVFDDRTYELAEGHFWHPEGDQPYWPDIRQKKLMTAVNGTQGYNFAIQGMAQGLPEPKVML